jgi:excisionase family DNA binding protein
MRADEQNRNCLTAKDVAKALRASMPTAYAIIAREDFPKLRFGRKIIVPRVDFERWLSEMAAKGGIDLKIP